MPRTCFRGLSLILKVDILDEMKVWKSGSREVVFKVQADLNNQENTNI